MNSRRGSNKPMLYQQGHMNFEESRRQSNCEPGNSQRRQPKADIRKHAHKASCLPEIETSQHPSLSIWKSGLRRICDRSEANENSKLANSSKTENDFSPTRAIGPERSRILKPPGESPIGIPTLKRSAKNKGMRRRVI
ncbi:hypothetical protein IAQ61_001467 [Plenodomus lingam]|uniref:uncharacterized protein n=1 Tax=Leptosphaeria maculans TaxID=5022 RepID=UPI0033212B3B|nr:hypothetical protein IAQ61_001467 [Plenodomus lingam]